MVLALTGRINGADPDPVQIAAALEQLVTKSISIGEQSVVAIATIAKDAEEPAVALRFPFGVARQRVEPTSPEFIPRDFGSGVIVDSSGLILTTLHVLGDVESSSYFVWHKQRPFAATVVATSPWYDLAVIQIDGDDFTPIEFGDASLAKKGNFVVALGNPMGLARDGNVSAAFGTISNIERRAPATRTRSADPLGRETLHHYGTLLQIDSQFDIGYSGGALLNLDGEMVGLTTSYAATDRQTNAAGLALPVNGDFTRIVDTLKRGHTPAFGFLGVGPEIISDSLRSQGYHGIQAVSVIAGTPAETAGLRSGDIITHVNEHPIFDESHLFWRIGILEPGSDARLRVVRGDMTSPDAAVLDMSVAVTKKFVNTIRQPVVTGDFTLWRGMRVDYATASPAYARMVQRPPADSLFIVDVTRESAAWQAELRVGNFVTHVGDTKVSTPAEFIEEVEEATGDVTLHVTSDGMNTTARTVSP